MSYDYRTASTPKPKYDVGDQVQVMDGSHVLFTAKIFTSVGYDDFHGCWRYKVKDVRGGTPKTFNETSLRPA